MADLLGVDRSTYSYYEIGKIIPDVSTVMKLANIFGVPYSSILSSETSSKFADSAIEQGCCDSSIDEGKITFNSLSYEEKCLIVAFRLLSEDGKKNMMNNAVKGFKGHENFSVDSEFL